MPLSLFEQHYQALQHLDNGVKIQIIEQLQKDVYQNPISHLFGSWEDNRTADEIIADIKGYSLEKNTNEPLLISEDRTDENWLQNMFAIADKAFKESELNGVVLSNSDDRGWTRDEIYER